MNDYFNEAEQITPAPPQDVQERKKAGLPRPPFYASEYLDMAEILQFAMDRFGQLILAIMRYTVDETVPEDFPPDINVMFEVYRRKIDFAREKYVKKCATNAENGSKGGKAKAENAKRKSGENNFKPPTQKQFRDAVAHFVDTGDINEDTSDYDSDAFFDQMKDNGWTINGKPITCRTDWEAAIRAKFFKFRVSSISHLYYLVFSAIFADFCPDGKENGGEWADNATYDFLDTYDEDSKCWTVQGDSYPAPKWEAALVHFMQQYSGFSDT